MSHAISENIGLQPEPEVVGQTLNCMAACVCVCDVFKVVH